MKQHAGTIALAGLGGYGHVYLRGLLGSASPLPFEFTAGIDPEPARCPQIEEIRRRGIPVYRSIEEFYRGGGRADLMVLCTPLHLHAEQTVVALENGSHVLCEKPLGGHPQQVQQMIEARDGWSRPGRKLQVAIGYQWSFSPAIHALKQDVMAGRFGRVLRLRSKVYWPRDLQYYGRSAWAGRVRDDRGRWVLDSPANNACAHYLHNMFYVLGEAIDRSAWPATVTAELYRANEIENYDTAVIRCSTRVSGHTTELLAVVSHATQKPCDPVFAYEFDKATIHYGGEFGDEIVAVGADGKRHSYGRPMRPESPEKLWDVLAAVKSGRPVACGPEAAGAQTAAVFAAQQSMPMIVDFPSEVVESAGHDEVARRHVRGLNGVLDRCYDGFKFPSELRVGWAVPGELVQLERPQWGLQIRAVSSSAAQVSAV